MSYIIKKTSPFVSIKLTETGREQLSLGRLNFSYWAIGDSELNYVRESVVDNNPTNITLSATSMVMRPYDRQPNLKYYIYPSVTNDFYKPINGGVLSVNKIVVNNQADDRGFFDVSGSSYTTKIGSEYVINSTLNTSTSFSGSSLPITTSAVTVGDLVLIKYGPMDNTALTPNENTKPLQNLWYKIQGITASSLTSAVVTVDRPLPSFTGYSQTILYRGGEVYDAFGADNTTAYWDSGTLSFDSGSNITCSDVPVWNMNNVWCETVAGVTGLTTTNLYEDFTKYGSYPYLGAKNPYFEYACISTDTATDAACNAPGLSYVDTVHKSISILHYTNNTISNLYGEFFYTDSANNKYLSIALPDLMYHRRNGSTGSGTTMGMEFIATGTSKYINNDIEYIELIEKPSLLSSGATPQVVGKVFPQLKTVVIDNDEIVAAMSYKSNRNWTLPELSAVLSSPSGGTSTGILDVDKTMYLTYVLDNVGNTSGFTSAMPCQTYIKITNTTSSAKDIQFKISETDMLPYMRKKETSTDGYGFYAYNFRLLYQIVSGQNDRPDPSAWKVYDYTTTAITSVTGQTINPKLLENQSPLTNGFYLDKLKDLSATTFSLINLLNLPLNASPQALQFGDERFFYGNLSTYIGATIYKTIFDITVNSDEYDSTTNPTRSTDLATNPANIKISEVGIYDTDKNLVGIGKISTPVALKNGNTITLELSMDF
jgi:hypothetical protein